MHIVVLLALLLTLSTVAIHSQTGVPSTGTISGSVRDSSGESLPGAKIFFTYNASGVGWSVLSNEAGEFSRPNLPTGTYSAIVYMDKYRRSSLRAFEVKAGSTVYLEAVLRTDPTDIIVRVSRDPIGFAGTICIVGDVPAFRTSDTPECPGEIIFTGSGGSRVMSSDGASITKALKSMGPLPLDDAISLRTTKPSSPAARTPTTARPFQPRLEDGSRLPKLIPQAGLGTRATLGIDGTFVISAHIGKDGHTVSAKLLESSSSTSSADASRVFDEARELVYEPAQLNGQPVEATVTVELVYVKTP